MLLLLLIECLATTANADAARSGTRCELVRVLAECQSSEAQVACGVAQGSSQGCTFGPGAFKIDCM